MKFEFWQVLILLGMFGTFILSAVCLGALAVFRTKKEGHEKLFGPQPKGEVFSLDDVLTGGGEDENAEEQPEAVKETLDISDKFVQQLSERLG